MRENAILLDSPLPTAVRTDFLFVGSLAVADCQAPNKQNGRAATGGEKFSIVTEEIQIQHKVSCQ